MGILAPFMFQCWSFSNFCLWEVFFYRNTLATSCSLFLKYIFWQPCCLYFPDDSICKYIVCILQPLYLTSTSALPSPRFYVQATDHGDSPRTSQRVLVTVAIRDLSNNQPVFDRPFYSVSVSESEDIGKDILQVWHVRGWGDSWGDVS